MEKKLKDKDELPANIKFDFAVSLPLARAIAVSCAWSVLPFSLSCTLALLSGFLPLSIVCTRTHARTHARTHTHTQIHTHAQVLISGFQPLDSVYSSLYPLGKKVTPPTRRDTCLRQGGTEAGRQGGREAEGREVGRGGTGVELNWR